MMTNKNKILYFGIVLIFALMAGDSSDTVLPVPEIKAKFIETEQKQALNKIAPSRLPAQDSQPVRKKKTGNPLNPSPSRFDTFAADVYFHNDLPELRGGVKILSNVKAVRSEDYREGQGKILRRQSGLIFIAVERNSETDQLTNVAYDEKNDRFHPVSSVLKVMKADPFIREELKSQGLDEYYYLESIKTLYLQSTNSNLLETYKVLLNKGLHVSLEITKALPKQR